VKYPPIICRNCGRAWPAQRQYSLHERLALEASPCPACGSATLVCPDAADAASPTGWSHRRRPPRFAPARAGDERAA
jgi:hypothetical protein